MFGYSQCPHLELTYSSCIFEAACYGAPNLLLEGKYDDDGEDPATLKHNASCSRPYRNDSILCFACAPGFSHTGLGERCDACPDETSNTVIGVAGICLGFIGLAVYVRMTVSKAGSTSEFSGVKSISLSFFQVLSLLSNFPIAWPALFLSMFRVGGVVTLMGQHLVNVKCMYPLITEAEVFYNVRIFWACVPPFLVVGVVLVWWLVSKFVVVDKLQAKMKASIVAMTYITWTGLCSTTFAMFACREVCEKTVLRADLNEQCFEGRHLTYVLFLGVPMLIVYVIGMPAMALVLIKRLHTRARYSMSAVKKLKGHFTWGKLYSQYDPRVWWWEGTVAFRKIVIAALGVFGESMGEMQVHIGALFIFFVIFATSSTRPYSEHTVLQILDQATLGVLFLIMWAGTVFNTYPRCEDDHGRSLAWCDGLSVSIGLLTSIVVFLIFLLIVGTKTKRNLAKINQWRMRRADSKRLSKMISLRNLSVNPLDGNIKETDGDLELVDRSDESRESSGSSLAPQGKVAMTMSAVPQEQSRAEKLAKMKRQRLKEIARKSRKSGKSLVKQDGWTENSLSWTGESKKTEERAEKLAKMERQQLKEMARKSLMKQDEWTANSLSLTAETKKTNHDEPEEFSGENFFTYSEDEYGRKYKWDERTGVSEWVDSDPTEVDVDLEDEEEQAVVRNVRREALSSACVIAKALSNVDVSDDITCLEDML
jgi:hypothetical protein